MDIPANGIKSESVASPTRTQERSREEVLSSLLKEGRILSARPIAQSGDRALLKLADFLLPVKTDHANLLDAENIILKVKSASLDNILMEIDGDLGQAERLSNFPQIKVNFIPDQENVLLLKNTNLKDGDLIPLKLSGSEENLIRANLAGQEIELEAQIEDLKGENVKLKVDFQSGDKPRLFLIENGQTSERALSILDEAIGGKENLSQNQLPKQDPENQKLLEEIFAQTKTKITLSGKSILPENILKFTLADNEKIVSNFKNLSFEEASLKEGTFKNQEIINFSKLTFDKKTGLAQGLLEDKNLFLKPILELKDNTSLSLRFNLQNGKAFFSLEETMANENREFLRNLSIKLGDFILDDKEIPEILKKIIDNKIPLTKENIQASQNFLNFSPTDSKSSLDLFLNQNLIMGLYYQLMDSKDRFILRGYKKKEDKHKKKEASYEFTILYESEELGDILIDLGWAEELKLDFYCQEEETAILVENNLDDLKENLKLEKIKIRVEHNEEKLKKDPVKTEKISLTKIDISV